MTQADAARVERFDALFTTHFAAISAYCRLRSRSVADAEDALAEVFLVAWRRLDEVPEGEGARGWLYATARRVTANQLRAGCRRGRLLERLLALRDEPVLGEFAIHDPRAELVHEALRRLKPRDQEVLVLAEWEQLSSAEIASALGCSETSARSRLHRARRRFRDRFEHVSKGRRRAEAAARSQSATRVACSLAPAQDALDRLQN